MFFLLSYTMIPVVWMQAIFSFFCARVLNLDFFNVHNALFFFVQMPTAFSHLLHRNDVMLSVVRLEHERELNAAELQWRRAMERSQQAEKGLRRRIRLLEQANEEGRREADRRVDVFYGMVARLNAEVSDLKRRFSFSDTNGILKERAFSQDQQQSELETLRAAYSALESEHTRLKSAVASARSLDDLEWVSVDG